MKHRCHLLQQTNRDKREVIPVSACLWRQHKKYVTLNWQKVKTNIQRANLCIWLTQESDMCHIFATATGTSIGVCQYHSIIVHRDLSTVGFPYIGKPRTCKTVIMETLDAYRRVLVRCYWCSRKVVTIMILFSFFYKWEGVLALSRFQEYSSRITAAKHLNRVPGVKASSNSFRVSHCPPLHFKQRWQALFCQEEHKPTIQGSNPCLGSWAWLQPGSPMLQQLNYVGSHKIWSRV